MNRIILIMLVALVALGLSAPIVVAAEVTHSEEAVLVTTATAPATDAELAFDPYLYQGTIQVFAPFLEGGCDQGDPACEEILPLGAKCSVPTSPCRCVADGRLCAVP